MVTLSPTIGEYRWQDPSEEIVRLVVAINDRCRYTMSYCARRPIVRSIVATDRKINRDGRRPMVRPIVASCDRSYEQSWHPVCDRSHEHSWHPVTERALNRGTRWPIVRSIVGCNDRSYDQLCGYRSTTIHNWSCHHARLVLRSFYDLPTIPNFFRSQVCRNLVVSPM